MNYLLLPIGALLVTLPFFFHPGYLMLLDWQGSPTLPSIHLDPTGGVSGIPIQLFLYILTPVVGGAAAQKLLIFFVLATIGYTTALLAKTLLPLKTPPLVLYTAGLFAMLNPFVYNRIQMGHIYLLAAYALTPLAIVFCIRFLKTPSVRSAFLASLMCTAVIAMSIHHIVLLPLLLLIIGWHERWGTKIQMHQYAALLLPFLSASTAILLVALWNPASPITVLTQEDLVLFAPIAQCSDSVLLDTVLLASQWRSPGIAPASCTSPAVLAAGILLLALMIRGSRSAKRLALGAIALILLARFPILSAMRDSAKFLADLAIVESILLAYGILSLSRLRSIPLLLVCIVGAPMFWGLSNTIQPREYPQSWYAFHSKLKEDATQQNVLFLPWHLYMPFDFTNQKTIGNPATHFFTHANIVQGDNLEMKRGNRSIATQSADPLSQKVETTLQKLPTSEFPDAFKELLEQEHIRYIALAHGSPEETMYKTAFQNIPYLRQESEMPGLTVYTFEE